MLSAEAPKPIQTTRIILVFFHDILSCLDQLHYIVRDNWYKKGLFYKR